MGIVEGILIGFILIIGVISMSNPKGPEIKRAPIKEDPNLARLRQMQEWDRFDDDKNGKK